MARIQITKRIFTEYSIKGRFLEFSTTIPLYNKHFGDLDRIDLEGKMSEDEFGNIFLSVELEKPKKLDIKYFCDLKQKKIPDSIFRPAKEILDAYQAPDYKNMKIVREAAKAVNNIEDLKLYLKEHYTFEKCEYGAKIAALVADRKKYKVAAVSGFLDNHHEPVQITTIIQQNKKYKYKNHQRHRWTLIKTPDGTEVCDPRIIPKEENRFVETVNLHNPISIKWIIDGDHAGAKVKSHIFTGVIWR
ncbi:MAG: hypothetical protein ACTSR3_15860 [Candidatus Helarchaeota archaeon]